MQAEQILTNSDIQKLNLALPTVEEMLEDRGYTAISLGWSFPETDIIKRMQNRFYETPDNKYAIVSIIKCIGYIQEFSNHINNNNLETIIFIYLNSKTIKHKTKEKNFNYKIEIWPINDLFINVSRHFLQPKIEKCEKVAGKLPKISSDDPICRYFKFKSKDFLKITNKEGFISYRMVI